MHWLVVRVEMWGTLKMGGIGRGEKDNEENAEDETEQDEAEEGSAGSANERLALEESDHKGKGTEGTRWYWSRSSRGRLHDRPTFHFNLL